MEQIDEETSGEATEKKKEETLMPIISLNAIA